MTNNDSDNITIMPFLKLLYRKLVLVILVTVLLALMGLGYAIYKVKPVYTVSRSFILCMSLSDSQSESTNASLGKIYMPQIESVIKSPSVMQEANELYKERYGDAGGTVSASSIKISYGNDSLIFSFSYSDYDSKVAEQKLGTVYDVVQSSLKENIRADVVKIVSTNNKVSESVNSGRTKYVVSGALIGAVLSVFIVFVIYVLDNTVKDKKEFEELTGVSVVAYIDKSKK